MRLLELISPNKELAKLDPYDFSNREYASGDDPLEDDENFSPFNPDNRDTSVDTYLKGLGFQKLGAGGYASVFSRPGKNYALKVFVDKPYLKFYEMCKKYPNIHFPKFYTQPRIIPSFKRDFGDSIYFCKLEKLQPMTSLTDDLKTWMDYFYLKNSGKQIYFDVKSKQFMGQVAPEMLERLNKLPRDQFTKAMLTIDGVLCDRMGLAADITEGNIMKRQDGTLVIIDPVQEPFVH